MQAAYMPPRTDKYVADTLQKLPHPPVGFFSYCPLPQNTEKQKVAGWGVASWEHTGLSSMSPFMPHSFTLSPH